MTDKNKPSKVLIFREKDTIFFQCLNHEVMIDRSLCDFTDSQYVMPGRSQCPNSGIVTAFIYEKTHMSLL